CVFNPPFAHSLPSRFFHFVHRQRGNLYPFLEFFLIKRPIGLKLFKKFKRKPLGLRHRLVFHHPLDVRQLYCGHDFYSFSFRYPLWSIHLRSSCSSRLSQARRPSSINIPATLQASSQRLGSH